MLIKINGQFTFCYNCPKISLQKKKRKIKLYKYTGSLLGILLGIFLLPQIAYFSDVNSEKLIELTNQERVKSGLNELTANQLLTQAAYNKGFDILKTQSFKHNLDDRKFSEWIRNTGYKYSYVGENLAIDFIANENIINAWLDSETHKKNILNSFYEEIGIAVVEGQFNNQNTILVVQIFGAPPKNIVQPKAMGINSGNSLSIGNYYLPTSINFTNENLLTHSISKNFYHDLNYSNYDNNINITTNNKLTKNKVNNFFEQYKLSGIIYYLSLVAYSLFIILILYLYFFCFNRLIRIVHKTN